MTGSSPADILQSFESGAPDNSLELNILPGTAAATVVPYTLTVTYEGFSQDFDFEFTVGEQLQLAEYDFDGPGAQGWSVGNPNDATTGTWGAWQSDRHGRPA